MQGEYVVNREPAEKHVARIQENQRLQGDEGAHADSVAEHDEYDVGHQHKRHQGKLSILMEGGQFIVNSAATIKQYEELEQINKSVNHELRGT